MGKKDNSVKLKYSLYSTNTNFLASLLVVNGEMDVQCIKKKLLSGNLGNCKNEKIPPVSSFNYLLQSNQNNGSYSVKATFNGKPVQICSNSKIEENCQIENFTENSQNNLIFGNYKDYCNLNQKYNTNDSNASDWTLFGN